MVFGKGGKVRGLAGFGFGVGFGFFRTLPEVDNAWEGEISDPTVAMPHIVRQREVRQEGCPYSVYRFEPACCRD